KEFPASRQVVVDNVEDFAFNARGQSCKDDGIGAVINIRQRQSNRSSQVKVDAECVDSNSSGNGFLAGTVNRSWTDDHAGYAEPLHVRENQFVLFYLCVCV